MRLLQLLLLFMVGLFVRRLYLGAKRRRPSRPRPDPTPHGTSPNGRQELDKLTQQDISDADFEEIP